MYYSEEFNDYDSDEAEELCEFNSEVQAEFKLDKHISIVQFYKELLIKEPEFIGINNICCAELLNIINTTIGTP